MRDAIPMGITQTAAEVVSRIIDPRHNLDFKIVPVLDGENDEGFEIHIFTLTSKDYSFSEKTLPKNPNTVEIKASETVDNISTEIIRSREKQFGKVRVIGDRTVVCFSVSFGQGTLEKKWTDVLETAYKAGTGNAADEPEKHDAAQASDQFRDVYQAFGVPSTWDFNGGVAAIKVDNEGSVSDAGGADYQMKVRRMLTWLPLRGGFDYSVDPAVDYNPAGHEPDLLPPQGWVYSKFLKRYVPLDTQGIGVSAAQGGVNVQLSASPNHQLALNELTAIKGSAMSAGKLIFDYNTLHLTLAIETDQRLVLEHELSNDGTDPVDGTLDIVVPGAACWVLAPYTVLGVLDNGALKHSTTTSVIRNDAARLAMIMAGAIARYQSDRARAVITIKGLLPWQGLLGQILSVVEDAGDAHIIQSPITSIEWTNSPDGPTTIVRTGFAR